MIIIVNIGIIIVNMIVIISLHCIVTAPPSATRWSVRGGMLRPISVLRPLDGCRLHSSFPSLLPGIADVSLSGVE